MTKRNPIQTPGPAAIKRDKGHDFTLPASLYNDSIHFYVIAENAQLNENKGLCETYSRAALLTCFSFYESLINQAAFGHAEAHEVKIPAFELDVLQEKETKLASNGKIQRVKKYFSAEARFKFICRFLSGKTFDCSGELWQNFQSAQKLRNEWAHPKPPFNTCTLSLEDVQKAIVTVRGVLVSFQT